jgi:hypothetical protein
MKSHHSLLAVGSVLVGAFLALNAQAQLTNNVSADPGNDTGVFADFGPQNFWTSGDIVLPTGTVNGTTPFEITLNLSHDLTLDGSGHYSWFMTYDASTPITPGNDLGSLFMVLLENGTPVTSQVGFDAGPNSFTDDNNVPISVTQFGTGNVDMPPNTTFNGVQIFVSNSNPAILDDVQITLDVPEPGTLALLSLGLVMLGLGCRKMNAIRGKL